jgi:hypothetical protein
MSKAKLAVSVASSSKKFLVLINIKLKIFTFYDIGSFSTRNLINRCKANRTFRWRSFLTSLGRIHTFIFISPLVTNRIKKNYIVARFNMIWISVLFLDCCSCYKINVFLIGLLSKSKHFSLHIIHLYIILVAINLSE